MPRRHRPTNAYDGNGHSLIPQAVHGDLAVIQRAIDDLACVDSLDEIKDIRDKAEAVRVYAREAKAGLEVQNKAAELKLRAERRAGELLLAMSLRGGDRRSQQRDSRPTLNDIGISQSQSKRWQKEALVSETDFCRLVTLASDREVELTAAALLRFAAKYAPGPSQDDDGNGHVAAAHPETRRSEDAGPVDPREIVAELLNHCHLLDRILSSIYEGGDPNELHDGQRRILRRLMRELLEMLTELRKHVTAPETEA